jgi:hypothetical protein
MRTPRECAAYMLNAYGKEAWTHCMYARMNNQNNPFAKKYWADVNKELDILSDRRHIGPDGEKNERDPNTG